MKKLIQVAASLAVLAAGGAASADDRAGAALLFSEGAGGLTEAEQSAVFAHLDLTVAPDGKSLVDRTCGQPAGSDVQFSDWNADGRKEVLVTYGNTCTSGMAGSSVVLFVKDAGGKYQPQLGFPGMIAEVLPAKHEGYPELLIGGPGFCFAVWKWDGKAYVHARNEPQSPGGCEEVKP